MGVKSLFLFFCILSIVSCVPRRKFGRFNRRALTRGRTWNGQPCPVDNGCIQLPSTRDLLTREEFENQVSGKTYFVMYQMFTEPRNFVYRLENTYFVRGESIFYDVVLRPRGGECISAQNLSTGNFTSATHAITFIPEIEFVPPVGTISPTYYFMSECTDEYLLLFTCLRSSTISNGFCNGGFFVDIALARDPPDRPPFWKIEYELYKKLGLKMNDPLNKFLYIGERCPSP